MGDDVRIGLQLNHTILELGVGSGIDPALYEYGEVLCDAFAAPLDSGYVIDPATRPLLDELASAHKLLAHGNYGAEFGFEPLDETPCLKRHLAIVRETKSPYYSDHLFFGFQAGSYMWSSPLPFSRAEVERVAGRAAAVQDRIKLPLLHENAFYYAQMPGGDMPEAEFIAALVDKAQTHLLLDLHNIYANSVNFEGYDVWSFLRTIPLDRVLQIHIAGGQHAENWYHDSHCNSVPPPVWEMLAYVLPRAPNLKAIVLEVQGPAHNHTTRPVDDTWPAMINEDLRRARAVLDETRQATASVG